MPYFIVIIFSMYTFSCFAEEGLHTTLESVENKIYDLNATIMIVNNKIDKGTTTLQQKQHEEILIRKKLVKQLNTFNKTVKDILRIQRLPQKALVFIDGLQGTNKRKNILEKGQGSLQNKIKNDKKSLKKLLNNLTSQQQILNDLSILETNLQIKQYDFNELRKIQIQLLTLKEDEKEELILQAQELEKSLNINGLFNDVNFNKSIKKHSIASITYKNMPVEGIITSKYNQKDEKGIHAQGVSILSTPSAEVKAIKDGHIIYSNKFREYGYLIILEHSDGYHTLYSGLNGGTKEIGDFISAGVTIGVLPAIEKPILYLEVRKNGVAVNPKELLKKLM